MTHPFSATLASLRRDSAVLGAQDYTTGKRDAVEAQPFSAAFLVGLQELERGYWGGLGELLPKKISFEKSSQQIPFEPLRKEMSILSNKKPDFLNILKQYSDHSFPPQPDPIPLPELTPSGAVVYAQGFVDGVAKVVAAHTISLEQSLSPLEKKLGVKTVQNMLTTTEKLHAYNRGVQLQPPQSSDKKEFSAFDADSDLSSLGLNKSGSFNDGSMSAYKLGFAVAIAVQYGVVLKKGEVPETLATHTAFMEGLRGEPDKYEEALLQARTQNKNQQESEDSFSSYFTIPNKKGGSLDLHQITQLLTAYISTVAYQAGKRVHDETTHQPEPSPVVEKKVGGYGVKDTGIKDLLEPDSPFTGLLDNWKKFDFEEEIKPFKDPLEHSFYETILLPKKSDTGSGEGQE
jgi:hypothetical protein